MNAQHRGACSRPECGCHVPGFPCDKWEPAEAWDYWCARCGWNYDGHKGNRDNRSRQLIHKGRKPRRK